MDYKRLKFVVQPSGWMFAPQRDAPEPHSAIEFFRVFSHVAAMEERPTQPPAPSGRKKIRLTKSEVYAMGIASPQKKRLAFGLVGLLIASVLAVVLW